MSASCHKTVAGLNQGGVGHINKKCRHGQILMHINVKTNTHSHTLTFINTHASLETSLLLPFCVFLNIALIFRQWWALWPQLQQQMVSEGTHRQLRTPRGETLLTDSVIWRTLWLSLVSTLCLLHLLLIFWPSLVSILHNLRPDWPLNVK